ncbi:putative Ig domain-containing protein, partial [Bordetella bronchiseptica]
MTPVDISGQFEDVDNGDTLTFTADGLPPGLTLDPATGIIS